MSEPAYDRPFFEAHHAGSLASAREMIPLVLEFVGPVSVVDVGCGTGTWLSVVKALGVSDIFGVDGDYVDRAALEIDADTFRAADLREPLELERTFDLVMCLEVAEHLPAASAETLIGSLAGLGPVVLFSAAIPLQGGSAHVNEQWPEYWASLFDARGFDVFDPIRPGVWGNERVEPWYAQNTLLYIRRGHPLAAKLEVWRSSPGRLSLVHPRLFTEARTKAEGAQRAYDWSEQERSKEQARATAIEAEAERLTARIRQLEAELSTVRAHAAGLESEMASLRALAKRALRLVLARILGSDDRKNSATKDKGNDAVRDP